MTSEHLISELADIHPTADVAATAVGPHTRIRPYTSAERDVRIGERCQIDRFCVVGRGSVIGNRVRISSGVHISAGTTIADDVTIGANCVIAGGDNGEAAVIREGASLGANVTLHGGVEVGQYSRVEDGSVVTGNVPPGATVVGNPAIMQVAATSEQDILKFRSPATSRIAGVEFLSLQEVRDVRGTLTVCQWNQQLSFEPKRTFFLHGVPHENVRGAHAHKECIQALVCFNGSVNVLLDDGRQREEFVLNSSDFGIVIPPGVWATQYKYTANAIMVVFASHDYAAADSIRDYDEFLNYRRSAFDSAA